MDKKDNHISRREFFALSYLSTVFLVKLFTPTNALAWVATRMRRGKLSSQYIDVGDITNSLRFRSNANAFLNRTPAGAGDRRIFTFSAFVKRGSLGSMQRLFTSEDDGTSAGNVVGIRFLNTDQLEVFDYASGYQIQAVTTQLFRDIAAFYHILVAVDSNQAIFSNAIKVWINGVQVNSWSSNTYSGPHDLQINDGTHKVAIGCWYQTGAGWGQYFDGYMSRVAFVDGQALTPSSFGYLNSNSNSWVTKSQSAVKGVVDAGGTNSFMLNFDNGTSTATLGNDKSSKGNTWTTNNFSLTAGSTYDWMTDSPTNNFCTLNSLYYDPPMALSSANLNSQTTTFGNWSGVGGTIAISSGKWYWETTAVSAVNPGTEDLTAGIQNVYLPLPTSAGGYASGSYVYITTGSKINSSVTTAYGASWTNSDVIGVALDLDAGTIEFYKNGVSQGIAFTGLSGTFTPSVHHSSLSVAACNFGQRSFAYTVPTGFKSLCTKNLPAPAITNAKKYFDTWSYTGNNTNQSITSLAFAPNMSWIKARNSAQNNIIADSINGAQKYLISNSQATDTTDSTSIVSFNANGITVGSANVTGSNAITYISWLWRAGGSSVANTNGTITSQVSVNQTSGFSIVTYTGSGANATVGHGLNAIPKLILVKSRTLAASDWDVYHVSSGPTKRSFLNLTNATQTVPVWQDTSPTSSLFSINGSYTNVNQSSQTYVAYCFAEVAGYSNLGSYTGNGSADGPFIFCGFRPRWIMIKRTDTAANWRILDTTRDISNPAQLEIYPNLTNTEQTFSAIDFLSNGFKIRNTDTSYNTNGGTYIFIAIAETPFKYSNAR